MHIIMAVAAPEIAGKVVQEAVRQAVQEAVEEVVQGRVVEMQDSFLPLTQEAVFYCWVII